MMKLANKSNNPHLYEYLYPPVCFCSFAVCSARSFYKISQKNIFSSTVNYNNNILSII